MNYNAFWTRISLLIILTAGGFFIAYSCGWTEDECDSYVSFMTPLTAGQAKVRPLYYTPVAQFYACELAPEKDTAGVDMEEMNRREWSAYTKNQVAPQAVGEFIHSMGLDTLRAMYDQVERGMPALQGLPANALWDWFRTEKDLEAFGYILFARRCEPVSTAAQNEWDVPVVDSVLCRKLLKDGRQLYAAAKKEFIKERYALQLIKTAFYAGRYKLVDSLYRSHYLPVKGGYSSVDSKVMGYYAGALYRSGKKAEAAYAFSRLFDESGDAAQAYSHTLGFVWAYSEGRLPEVIRLCRNSHEKAMVYALAAMRETEPYRMQSLQQIYQLEPDNPYLDVLLIREINKVEQDFLEYKYNAQRGYWLYNAYYGDARNKLNEDELKEWMDRINPARKHLQEMSAFMERTAGENKLRSKALWLGAAAYLHLLADENEACGNLLQRAAESNPTPKVATQLRILQLVYSVQRAERITPFLEEQLAVELNWLEQYSRQHKDYHRLYKNLLKTTLPLKYAAQQDSLRMLYCYAAYEREPNYLWDDGESEEEMPQHFRELHYLNSGLLMDYYFTQQQLDSMMALNHRTKSSFEQWLLKKNRYSDAVISELKAVKYFRSFQYEQAKSVLAQGDNWPSVPDLFVAHIRDYQEGYDSDTLHMYSMKEVLDTLISLKQRQLSDLRCAFDYGCALYSLSYHGRCHAAWTFYRESSATEPYYYSKQASYSEFERQYWFVDEASQVFERVYRDCKMQDTRQQALWMLAKCRQKRCGLEMPAYLGFNWMDQEGIDYVKWNVEQNNWLAVFHSDYKGTPYYDSVYQECSYLRLYAAQH